MTAKSCRILPGNKSAKTGFLRVSGWVPSKSHSQHVQLAGTAGLKLGVTVILRRFGRGSLLDWMPADEIGSSITTVGMLLFLDLEGLEFSVKTSPKRMDANKIIVYPEVR